MKFILLLCAFLAANVVLAADQPSLYDIPLKDIKGNATTLKDYKGKAVLIVNVASKCGYTKQYTALEALHQEYKGKGLTIIGIPCNDFGGQEPGTAEEIVTFCTTKYNVTFPLYEKVHVKKGPEQHPLYATLTGDKSPFPGEVKWNFNKFLISKDGKIVNRFESKVTPDSAEMKQAVEAALAK